MRIQEASSDEEEEFVAKDDDDDDDDSEEAADEGKTKTQKNDQGEAYFDLNSNSTRRCTVRTFKGKVLVDLREVRHKHMILFLSLSAVHDFLVCTGCFVDEILSFF